MKKPRKSIVVMPNRFRPILVILGAAVLGLASLTAGCSAPRSEQREPAGARRAAAQPAAAVDERDRPMEPSSVKATATDAMGTVAMGTVATSTETTATDATSTETTSTNATARDETMATFAVPEGARTAVSNDGRYYVVCLTEPRDIPLNELFSLDVRVFENSDRRRPLDDQFLLAADADMPEHRHGMIRSPRVREIDAGRFEVKGMMFHMPGLWELYIDITRAGITERSQFEIHLE